jgi:TolB protein
MRQLYADNVEQPIYLYWSPEGDSVSFIASQEQGGLGLHLAPKDGLSPAELVATSPSTFFWDWMPDGSQVLIHTGFTALDIDESRLAFIQIGDALDPAEIVQHGYFQAPAVASDGRFYSYSDEDPAGRRWLIVWDIENEQQVELIFHQGVVAMGFSPTRAQLAYISPERDARSFYGPLRLLDLESGEAQMLVPQVVLAYFWSPDGQSIAYLTLEELDDPLDFDDAPVAMQSALSRSRGLSKIQPPPDEESNIGLGLSVIDVDSGEVRRLAVFEPSDTFVSQFLPFFDQYALSHRLWSPDSQALVLPMKDSNNRDFIVVVPADGSEPVTVARGVVAFWSR